MKTFRAGTITSLAVALYIADTGTADAYTGELYVYNGFHPVVGALKSIALIFSDVRYNGLFISIVILGILFGMMAALFKAGLGMRINVLSSWAIPVMVGVALYLALVVPKGTIWVYDTVKNRQEAVSGVPDGMVVILTLLNKVERGLVDIIDTSGFLPLGMEYNQQAGGVGFDMLLGVGRRNGILFDNLYINHSLNQYTDDCVWWGTDNPNLAPANVVRSSELGTNSDFLAIFDKAAYWPIYTVYYDINQPGGVTGTCHDIWFNKLKPQLTNPANYTTITDALCAQAGYDPTIPGERTQCVTATQNALNWVENTPGAYTTRKFLQQAAIARSIDTIVQKYSPDAAIRALTARNAGTGMLSTGVAANEWIPLVRAVTMAIAIGLTPFLILFLPTPLFPKVVGMFLGFFVWITAWGVTDAIVHQFAMNHAVDTFAELRRHQLGYHAIMMFETAGMKTLAIFGAIRWTGAMLATVMTMMIIRFGGHAMAAFAGQLTAMPQRAGVGAGMDTVTPEGSARTMLTEAESRAYMRTAHKYGFGDRAGAITWRQAEQIETNIDTQKALGGLDKGAERAGYANAMKTTQGVGAYKNVKHDQAINMGQAQTARALAGVDLLKILGNGKGDWTSMRQAAKKQGFSHVSHTGQARLGGTKLDGTNVSAYTDDGTEVSRAFTGFANKTQLGDIADWGQRQGYHEFGNYMKTLASNLKDGERVKLSMTGNAGGWATVTAEQGASAQHFDTASDRETFTLAKGIHVDSATAGQMARSYGPALFHSLTEPGLTKAQQRARAIYTAGQIDQSLLSKTAGRDTHALQGTSSARIHAKGGVDILGTGVGTEMSAGASISGETSSIESVNTRVVAMKDIMMNDLGKTKGLPREERDRLIAQDIGNYINNSDKEASSESFGVKKPVEWAHSAQEGAQSTLEDANDFWLNTDNGGLSKAISRNTGLDDYNKGIGERVNQALRMNKENHPGQK